MTKRAFAVLITAALLVGASAGAYKPQCKDSSGRLIVCSGNLDNTQAPTSIAASTLTGTVSQANGGLGVDASALSNGVLVKSGGVMSSTTAPTMSGANISASTVANASLANSSVTVSAGTGLTGGGAVSLGGSTSLAVAYGTTAGTAAQGNDARLNPTPSAAGRVPYDNGTGYNSATAGTATQVLHGGTTPGFSAVSLTADVSDVLPVANGGTGQTSYTVGDLLYASTTTALSKLAAGTSGYVLTAAGAGVAPAWAAPITNTTGSSSLSSTYNVTTSYGSVGLSVSLPSAGKYRVFGEVRCQLQVSSSTGNITIRLYNSTAASAITDSERISDFSASSVITGSTVPISEYITVAGATTIDVQAIVPAGPTYTFAQILSDTSGRSRLHYEKVGP